MRSKASVRGHPIHPALIPFPIAFLVGALAFDAIGLALGRPRHWSTGGHLVVAGILSALIAAVPGLIDYAHTVPPRSSAKTRATRHMLSMLGAVALFAVALWIRPVMPAPPDWITLGLEALGVGLIAVGGWMGGTLVGRNQISVDHRYAEAGK